MNDLLFFIYSEKIERTSIWKKTCSYLVSDVIKSLANFEKLEM